MAAKKKTSQSGKRAGTKTAAGAHKAAKKAKSAKAPQSLKKKPKASPKKAAKKPAPKAKPVKKAPLKKVVAKRPPPKAAARPAKKAAAPSKATDTKKAALLAKKQKLDAQKQKALALKERALLQKEKERERALALKEQDRLKKEKEREKERLLKEKERALAQKEQDRLKKERDKEREKERLLKDKEKDRLKKEQDRLKKEKEREKERLKKEKERERLEAQKKREEERLKKEKEREAYRKAREAERERVRSEKEAARRALEGRVARQQRQQQRIAGTSRGSSARVYRPDAIPSQAGTTREHLNALRPISSRSVPVRQQNRPAVPPSAGKPRPPEALDERWALIQKRLGNMPERFQREYSESFDMSWIHHDSALEGVVYTFQELKTAVDPNIVIVPDSSLQPVCEEIRRHKIAIDWVRELGRDDTPLSADTLKKLYVQLHPEEGDLKSVKYRKEIPQHRLYFHEYAPPDKIAVRVRQAFEWLHGPEPEKLKDPVRVAARLHYDLLRTFPFPLDSGKVARMLMNILLLRANLPPVIVHSTERQRYYDALRGSLPTIVQMVTDSVKNALISIEKVLDEEEDKVASQAAAANAGS